MRFLKLTIWLLLVAAIWGATIYYKSASRRVQALPASNVVATDPNAASTGTYREPMTLATLKNRSITESSGLTASRTNPGLYWTHNDSGNGPFIFAFDAGGASRGVWQIPAVTSRDWEDIAAGPGPDSTKSYLYIGDIGDNGESRSEIVVHRIPEPVVTPAHASSTKAKPLPSEPAEVFRFRYPDGTHDAETLMVHPQTGNLYIVTKVLLGEPGIYEAVPPFNVALATTMRRVGGLNVPSLLGGFVTGGSISPDGSRVALCDYFRAYELVLPPNSSSFDMIWKQSFTTISLGQRKQGEAIAYRLDSKALLATSEGRFSPIIQVVRK